MTLGCSCQAYSAAALLHRDVVQPPVFVTATLQRKLKKIAHSSLLPGLVAARRSSRYKTLPNTEFVFGQPHEMYIPHSWIEYGFLLSAYATPFFSCSIAWNWSSHWHWWFPCAVACPASRDIDGQVTAWKFLCPFSPYSVSPRQGTYWETNAGRIVLHLKFVIWHRSATRFCNSQGGMKTLHDEYFGSSPLCLIFFICSDSVWNQS